VMENCTDIVMREFGHSMFVLEIVWGQFVSVSFW
jgi:hypothetical protein